MLPIKLSMHDHFIQRIKAVFSHPIETIKVIDHGWSNLVFEINGEWMFRFLQSDLGRRQIEVERAFLPLFSKVSPIAVPVIEYQGEDFIGYKKIHGEPLTHEKLSQLSPVQKSFVAQQLGSFLTALHNFLFSNTLVSEHPYGVGDFLNEAWEPVAPLLSLTVRQKAFEWFNSFFAKTNLTAFAKTLTHCDLGTNNIIFDDELKVVSGIIDFGDLALGDPARDFNGFLRHHGAYFVDEILKHYKRPIEADFAARIEYHAKKQPFIIIEYAKQFNHPEVIPDCIQAIESSFV